MDKLPEGNGTLVGQVALGCAAQFEAQALLLP
jgi:hypothetical protein